MTRERRAEKLSFRPPGLFSSRLLSKWHHGCSIAMMSPWPHVSIVRRYCDLTICGNAWACKVLGNDRAVILCISWKDSLYYLSTGLGQLSWFIMRLNPRSRHQKLKKKRSKRICIYIVLGLLSKENEIKWTQYAYISLQNFISVIIYISV